MHELWTSVATFIASYVLQALIGRLLDWGERQRTLSQAHIRERDNLIDQRDRAEKRANEFARLLQELQDKHLEQDRIIEALYGELKKSRTLPTEAA